MSPNTTPSAASIIARRGMLGRSGDRPEGSGSTTPSAAVPSLGTKSVTVERYPYWSGEVLPGRTRPDHADLHRREGLAHHWRGADRPRQAPPIPPSEAGLGLAVKRYAGKDPSSAPGCALPILVLRWPTRWCLPGRAVGQSAAAVVEQPGVSGVVDARPTTQVVGSSAGGHVEAAGADLAHHPPALGERGPGSRQVEQVRDAHRGEVVADGGRGAGSSVLMIVSIRQLAIGN